MVKIFPVLLFYLVFSIPSFSQGIPPIGHWREHLPYNNAINVVPVGQSLFCGTPYSFFSYDIDANSFDRYSKISGLSETGLDYMVFDSVSGSLVIAYQNSNIDYFSGNQVINLPDIKLSTTGGDKSIKHIYCLGDRSYLSTGLGIIVLNNVKHEVATTYRIGMNGDAVSVNAFTADNQFFYAATAEGLKRAFQNAASLEDFKSWTLISGSQGLPAGECASVLNAGGMLVTQQADSLYYFDGNSWPFLYHDGWRILHLDYSENRLLLSEEKNGQGRVVILKPDGTIETIKDPPVLTLPRQAVLFRDALWIADQNNGLIRIEGDQPERIFPNSPINIASGEMIFDRENLWVTAGSVNDAWNYTYNPNGIYRFSNDYWTGINLYVYPQLDTLLDFITIAADRLNGSVYAGSYGGGLLEIRQDGSFNILKQNSPLQPAIGDPLSYRVSGLAVDAGNNLWISNYGAPQDLLVRKTDGSWKSFTIPFLHNENAVSQIIIDETGQKWIMSPKGNGVFCFNDGGTIDDTGDDRWKFFQQGKGNGNLPGNLVLSLALDRFGFIWIGTDKGIGIVQCPQEVFSNNACEAYLPVVQQDNFTGYLFQDESVQTIAVDGANRKWVGTRNGVWLISPEGDKIIYRFTEENSPLLSNDVKKITIDPATGEVFMATFKGICSFRSTATEGGAHNEKVLVFPNPVPPGYNGTIAVRGLLNDALVRITELNGRLVYQSRALGGQVVWDGKDYKGNRVSSGAYLVLVSDQNGKENLATKIFFIR